MVWNPEGELIGVPIVRIRCEIKECKWNSGEIIPIDRSCEARVIDFVRHAGLTHEEAEIKHGYILQCATYESKKKDSRTNTS